MDDILFPGAGMCVATVKAASRRTPIVLGKPATRMLDLLDREAGLVRERTVMIGDRIETDIAFGRLGGLSTLLVLSGVSDEAHLTANASREDGITPDYVLSGLKNLLDINPSERTS